MPFLISRNKKKNKNNALQASGLALTIITPFISAVNILIHYHSRLVSKCYISKRFISICSDAFLMVGFKLHTNGRFTEFGDLSFLATFMLEKGKAHILTCTLLKMQWITISDCYKNRTQLFKQLHTLSNLTSTIQK